MKKERLFCSEMTPMTKRRRRYEVEFDKLSPSDKIDQAGLLIAILRLVIAKVASKPRRQRRIVASAAK